MNDYMKLREEYTNNLCKANDKELGRYFKKLDVLQKELCNHEKARWLQEIDKDGEFKDGLFKRCMNCGLTLDTIAAPPEKIEELLKQFDAGAEALKASLDNNKTDGGK